MHQPETLASLESLLFVAGDDGFELKELAKLIGKTTLETYQNLQNLAQKYQDDPSSALELRILGEKFVLTTKTCYADLLKNYANSSANFLSKAALETLAIIAYRGPVARSQIDELRGVNSSGMIQKLIEFQLIVPKGRLDAPGRPILYETSAYFMNYFGLTTLADLPEIDDLVTDQEQTEDLFFSKNLFGEHLRK